MSQPIERDTECLKFRAANNSLEVQCTIISVAKCREARNFIESREGLGWYYIGGYWCCF
jgi:hypothetical protein